MKLVRQFWSDEGGNVSAFTTVLIMTILILGMIPGIVTLRDHIVQHFGDAAVALDSLDQSYSYSINGVTSQYIDSSSLSDGDGDAPADLDLTIPATSE